MNVKVGDTVRFLNDVGGGKVVGIIDRNTAMVLNDDEFEVPTPMSELVVVESASDNRLRENRSGNTDTNKVKHCLTMNLALL